MTHFTASVAYVQFHAMLNSVLQTSGHLRLTRQRPLRGGQLGYSYYMEETSKGMPQFATAEYAPNTPTLTCAACGSPIAGPYYQINGVRTCVQCSEKIQAQIPQDSHAAFVRALLFGILGALVGFALYVTFALATGLVIGWVCLAVGFIVGKRVLTYLAVSLSAVPIAIHQIRQHHQAQVQSTETAPKSHAHASFAKAIGVLALLGIASPLLELQDPSHGIIGLIILFVGIRFAWRLTAGRAVVVSVPHTLSPAGSFESDRGGSPSLLQLSSALAVAHL